jgi:hypothetical protein
MLLVLGDPNATRSEKSNNGKKIKKNGKNKRERAAPAPDIETLTSFERGSAPRTAEQPAQKTREQIRGRRIIAAQPRERPPRYTDDDRERDEGAVLNGEIDDHQRDKQRKTGRHPAR